MIAIICRAPVRSQALTNATSNWLLAAHPDIYLFGTLVEAEPYLKNDERMPMWTSRLDKALTALRLQGERELHTGSSLRMRARVLGSKMATPTTNLGMTKPTVGGSTDTIRIAVRPAGASLANEHYVVYGLSLTAGSTFTFTSGVTLATTDVITVYSTTGTSTFSAFGSELS